MTPNELIERAARALQHRYGERAPVVTLTDDARTVIRIALEEALAAVAGEAVVAEADATDTSYNTAIRHAASAIRALLPQEDGDAAL